MRAQPRLTIFTNCTRSHFSASLPLFCLWALAATLLPGSITAQSPPSSDSSTQPAPVQQPAKPAEPPPNQSAEVVTRDSATTFKVRVNLVLVRVVVRDESGKVVENLKKEDFQLFDNRKLQTISTFSMETPASRAASVVAVSTPEADVEKAPGAVAGLPQRFVSLLFDDIHLTMQDSLTVRTAATKMFDALAPSDRVGIYTTSGQVTQEFTSDQEILKDALSR